MKNWCLSILLTWSSLALASVTDQDLERWGATWDSLVPAGAYDFLPDEFDMDLLQDPDFQAKLNDAAQQMNPELNGTEIELVGFMVPIETLGDEVMTFLLVPEAGQCVHVPPPPVNQTILVDSAVQPVDLVDLYQVVKVRGRLLIQRTETALAESGYLLRLQSFEQVDLGFEIAPPPGADGDRF